MRGKHRDQGGSQGRDGLIPACAGKTPIARPDRLHSWAHPRVCGENERVDRRLHIHTGSSPRVRGKHARGDFQTFGGGLIPACAGKTLAASKSQGDSAAHPRVCGENQAITRQQSLSAGSSPRVRGKPENIGNDSADRGLIPACAGKTSAASSMASKAWAHPRVCGENPELLITFPRVEGSSPRVRGKRPPLIQTCRLSGLIPACAGKTIRASDGRAPRRAHRRVCGENPLVRASIAWSAGSSPRVRGKQGPAVPRERALRLIPACAGKTGSRHLRQPRPTAHPRVCGENGAGARTLTVDLGSSPRVRGKQTKEKSRNFNEGLIPACAGKTMPFGAFLRW